MQVVLKIAVAGPLRASFDYLPPEGAEISRLKPGIRVKVPFGRGNRPTVGFLLEVAEIEGVEGRQLKTVDYFIDNEPLISVNDQYILAWASHYYHHPVGEVFAAAFPVPLRQGRSVSSEVEKLLCLTESGKRVPTTGHAPRQSQLLEALRASGHGVPVRDLNLLGWNWRRPAQSLIAKGWAYFGSQAAAVQPRCVGHLSPAPALNDHQRTAVDEVLKTLNEFKVFLLDGVTGSGKTGVYLRLVDQVMAQGSQAMILLPEISLTPQLEARFRGRLSARLVVYHSSLSEADRCRAWLAMQRGEASILLGTRSAVFAPMARPGLIILDEEHDASFKQQEGFRFSARDVAIMRARGRGIPVVLGSATPSLESLLNVRKGRFVRLSLPDRTGSSLHPSFRLIDIRSQTLVEGLSRALIAQIRATLERGEQALIFLNRRGFAPTLICHACGWVADCARCDAHLVIHHADDKLLCHHCGHEELLAKTCPRCRTSDLRALGLGTEKIEHALERLFPKARLLRIDRDSTRRKGSLEDMLEKIHAGEVDILLGTQMLAKGHHFPNVTLVGVLDVDGGLFSTDFRAGERTAQLIMQVAGRAGREERPGQVLLQTRQPEHPLLVKLIKEGYAPFAEAALAERREAELPPYSHQALFRAEANDPAKPPLLLTRLAALAGETSGVSALGPIPAPMTRQAGRFRYQLLLQSDQRKPLHECVDRLILEMPALPESRQARWSVDIDPVDLY